MSRLPPTDLPAAAQRILVVDDHRKIREPLAVLLRRAGFDVRVADTAAAMWTILRHAPIDLVVLDAMLPDGDGFALCGELCAQNGPAVILLTARSEVQDRIAGLQRGADDYLVKPFEPDELLARIRAVLRRTAAVQRPAAAAAETVARAPTRHAFGPWTLDEDLARLTHADGHVVTLSATELRLLGVFVRQARNVVSRLELQEQCGAVARAGFERTIDRQVSRLRGKLEDDPREPHLLRTAWGDGYVLAVDSVALP